MFKITKVYVSFARLKRLSTNFEEILVKQTRIHIIIVITDVNDRRFCKQHTTCMVSFTSIENISDLENTCF